METRRLIPLGQGVYTVAEVCRILAPTMTPRKVHYWLDTGLIHGTPVSPGSRGRPTLLTYRQLLEIRTVQYLRDHLRVRLEEVRGAFAWVLSNTFGTHPQEVRFTLISRGRLAAELPNGEAVDIRTGSGVIPMLTDHLNDNLREARQAWVDQRLLLRPCVVADPRIVGGAPTLSGTRIETAFIAAFATDGQYTDETIAHVMRTYPQLTRDAVTDAMDFERLTYAA